MSYCNHCCFDRVILTDSHYFQCLKNKTATHTQYIMVVLCCTKPYVVMWRQASARLGYSDREQKLELHFLQYGHCKGRQNKCARFKSTHDPEFSGNI